MEDDTNGLVDAIIKSKSKKNKTANNTELFSSGRRNNDFISVAGIFRRKGASEAEILKRLTLLNASLDQPLELSEISAIAKSSMRYDAKPEDFTHDTMAKLLASKFEENVIYVPSNGFYYFDGKIWQKDIEDLYVTHLCREMVYSIFEDIEQLRDELDHSDYKKLKASASKLKSNGFIKSVVELVKSERAIIRPMRVFFDNPDVLTFTNGTLELNSLAFREFRQNDFCLTALDFEYDAKASCPLFERFLLETFASDVANFICRVFGYALLGRPAEQKLFILQGHGQNGKSVLVGLMQAIFGDLSVVIQPESLNGKLDGQIRTDLVRLLNKRLMVTSETKAGTVLDAALIKQITGQDTLTARELYEASIEFKPQCVPVMQSNFLPVVDGGDYAMARRLCVITFDKRVECPDHTLSEKLLQERAGVLNLLLKGIVRYRQSGLSVPQSVLDKTISYVERSDLMKGFYSDCLIESEGEELPANTMQWAYIRWCNENGYKPLSANTFKESFERRSGHTQLRNVKGRYWPNLKLR